MARIDVVRCGNCDLDITHQPAHRCNAGRRYPCAGCGEILTWEEIHSLEDCRRVNAKNLDINQPEPPPAGADHQHDHSRLVTEQFSLPLGRWIYAYACSGDDCGSVEWSLNRR